MSSGSYIRSIHPLHFLTSKRKSATTHIGMAILLAVLATLSLSWPQEALTQSYKSNAANDSWMRQQQDQQRQQMHQQQQAKQRELIRQQQQKFSNDNKQKVIRDQQQKAANDNKQSETARQKARSQGATYQGTNKPTSIVISNGIARMARPLTAGEIQRGFTGKVTADGRALIKFQNRIFTVPASRVSGLSARLAADKQRKIRWTAQLQEGVNKKIKAIATATTLPATKRLSGPKGPDCEPKDSPKCRESGEESQLQDKQKSQKSELLVQIPYLAIGHPTPWDRMTKEEKKAFQHSYSRHGKELGLPSWKGANADELRQKFNTVVKHIRDNGKHSYSYQLDKGEKVKVNYFTASMNGRSYYYYETLSGRFISAGLMRD